MSIAKTAIPRGVLPKIKSGKVEIEVVDRRACAGLVIVSFESFYLVYGAFVMKISVEWLTDYVESEL